jgi:hypothetical protein
MEKDHYSELGPSSKRVEEELKKIAGSNGHVYATMKNPNGGEEKKKYGGHSHQNPPPYRGNKPQ